MPTWQQWFQFIGLFSLAMSLLTGVLIAVTRLYQQLWGKTNAALFGSFQTGKAFVTSSGLIPLTLIRIGTFSLILLLLIQLHRSQSGHNLASWLLVAFWSALGLLVHVGAEWFVTKISVGRLRGILGGMLLALIVLIGVVLVTTLILKIWFPILLKEQPQDVFGPVGLFGLLLGAWLGMKIGKGRFGPRYLQEICTGLAREFDYWVVVWRLFALIMGPIVFWLIIRPLTWWESILTIIAGTLIGGLVGVGIGMLYGSWILTQLLAARGIGWSLAKFLRPLVILLVFKKILCETCWRYTFPLRAHYAIGVRTCEHCGKAVLRTRVPGKLIITFGNINLPAAERQFVRANPDLETTTTPMDIAEMHLDPATVDLQILEKFITYIINYPPQGGVATVKIICLGELDALGPHLKNALRNTFPQLKNG
jgi:hypothetical protein